MVCYRLCEKVISKKQIRDENRQLQVLRERIAMTHASKYVNTSSTSKLTAQITHAQDLFLQIISIIFHDRDDAEYFVKLHCAFQNSLYLFLVMEYTPVISSFLLVRYYSYSYCSFNGLFHYRNVQCGDCLSLLMAVKKIHEHVAQHIIAQISLAVQHLHSHGVVHRFNLFLSVHSSLCVC